MPTFAFETDLSTPNPEKLSGGVIVMGNFDGVHRGHYAVIRAAIDQAQRLGNVQTHIVTFEPHSRSVFKPDHPPFRLTPAPVKMRLLKALGADAVAVVTFSPEFSCVKAPEFVDRVIIRQFHARHVVAGFDFVFGYQRGGNMDTLRNLLVPHGVGVTKVMPYRDMRGEIMSSTRTREALQKGDMETSRHILGRPWSISGIVRPGTQRGRSLGFPTANIDLGDYLRPKFGVYAIYARQVGTMQVFPGVANIGTRPTVGGNSELLEFHLFDFYDTIYGQEWEIELIDFLRAEETFPDIQALKDQIVRDAEQARTSLSHLHL